MSGECGICGDHTVECTCEGDYKEAYQRMNQYWSKEIDMRFFHLNAKLKPLDDTTYEEHEFKDVTDDVYREFKEKFPNFDWNEFEKFD